MRFPGVRERGALFCGPAPARRFFRRTDDRQRSSSRYKRRVTAGSQGGKMSAAVGTTSQHQFLQELIYHGHYLPSGEPGVYGRGRVFEDVRTRLDNLITRIAAVDKPETPRFPPLIPKRILEKVGYLGSFPQLCGVVHSFAGNHAAALDMAERASRGDDWSMHL